MDQFARRHNAGDETDYRPTPQDLIEAKEDFGRNCSTNPTMGDIVNRRFSRRGFSHPRLMKSASPTHPAPP